MQPFISGLFDQRVAFVGEKEGQDQKKTEFQLVLVKKAVKAFDMNNIKFIFVSEFNKII